MDRLTITLKLPKEGEFREYSEEQLEEIKRADKVSHREIYRRLQAYEDTGLSPEEIAALISDNKRLHELINSVEDVLKGSLK